MSVRKHAAALVLAVLLMLGGCGRETAAPPAGTEETARFAPEAEKTAATQETGEEETLLYIQILSLIHILADWSGHYICVSNVHTTVTAYEDEAYRKVQNGAVMALPDGGPLSKYCRKRGYPDARRVTGPDLMKNILFWSAEKGWRHYFYGSTQETPVSYTHLDVYKRQGGGRPRQTDHHRTV